MKKLIGFAFVMLVIAGVVSSYIYFGIFKKEIQTNDQESIHFFIKTNANFDDVVLSLEEQKVINSASKFGWLAELRSLNGNIYPGRYTLKKGMNWSDLILYLRQGKIDEVTVTFNNVRTLEQLAEKVATQIEATEDDLLEELTNSGKVEERGYDKETFLSVFIPNTYKMYWNSSAKEFVDRMEKEHKRFWNSSRMKKANALKLSPVEISVLASIVQSEQNKFADEWPIIAGLYINRLKKGMLLQSDPTVVYAWGDFSMRRVWSKHLKIDHPYNTYKYKGLPPGPIRVPSSGVIDGVLNYKKHKYLYMCANPKIGGKHAFANSYKQHLRNAAIYSAYMNKKKIR